MAREITEQQLRNESDTIMQELARGQSFVVTRAGAPVGELVPLRRRRFVSADAAVAAFRTAPPIDHRVLRADLEHVADQDPKPHV